MQKLLKIFLVTISISAFSQTDYSDSWEDFYSYNKVLDFFQNTEKIIALSDNAVFVYHKQTQEMQKISSVHGLSGETASSIYYDENLDRIVIGYESGLLEIVDSNGKIYKKPDIVNFGILGEKTINHISANGTDLYLSTPFGIVVFDLANLDFKNTYFIGSNSSEVFVNETLVFNNKIYAVTKQGIYIADLNNPFLIDYANWTKYYTLDYTNIVVFNNQIYVSFWNEIDRLNSDNSLTWIANLNENCVDLRANETYLTASASHQIVIFDQNFNAVQNILSQSTDEFYFSATSSEVFDNQIFIATNEFGILRSDWSNPESFTEIHPEGPLSNAPFSISVLNENLWVVYGGYDDAYTPKNSKYGISHFNGSHWVNLPYASDGVNYRDLVHVNIDPNHENRVYVSSWGDGMLIIENDEVTTRWNHQNSALEKLDYPADPNYISIRIGSSIFDNLGNLWVVNAWVANRLKKYSTSQQWSSYNLSSIITNQALGLNEVIIDDSGNKWIGSRRNGALVVNESGSKMMNFITTSSKGNLPDLNVRSLAVDRDNRVWIGTKAGLRYFNASSSMFDLSSYEADYVFVPYGEDDTYGETLLGSQTVNAICVDGADNKWFGTDGAGILCTNPSGKETLYQFNKTNSPLPSNKILKIRFDASTGKIYIATDKGIVAYNSKIAPYGDTLQEVYAYPNPVKSNHEYVTIDGRNGTHIPYGTNVKILDASGKLVYETNVKEGQEEYGGKVVWDKTNLAGKKVASGVYVVLLFYKDNVETAVTKIAIIN